VRQIDGKELCGLGEGILLLIQEENRSEGLLGAKNKAKERIYPKISALNEYKIHFAFDIDSAIESHF